MQVVVVWPLLRRTVSDVSTARAMLLTLPPELLVRVPAIVRFLYAITNDDSAVGRRPSGDATETDANDDPLHSAPAKMEDNMMSRMPISGGMRHARVDSAVHVYT